MNKYFMLISVLITLTGLILEAEPSWGANELPKNSFGKKYEHLIPEDATLVEYDPHRFALISGAVISEDGVELAGVSVTILNKPEYGSVLTNDDGKYLLPVEGGGSLTVAFEKDGFTTVHRHISVHWNDIAVADLVRMLEFREPSRVMKKAQALSKSGRFSGDNIITYRSQETNDKTGSRACTVVMKGSTNTYAGSKGRMTKVATQTPQISAVEYTTPESMPAQLPPNSAFTYCVDLSVNGEEHAEFDEPVAIWVENFLDFKVGEPVPVGHYNRDKAVWEPSDNGVVVRLLDTDSDGVVDGVDADDDGQPDDLNGNGLFTDEVAGLGDPNHYPPGKTFWGVMVSHFSPLDLNWSYGPPSGAIGASFESFPDSSDQEPEYTVKEDCNSTGSIIKDRKGTLHQDMPIPGTDLFLHYASQAATGYTYQFSVKAIGEDVPDNLKGVDVKVEIAGRTVELNERLAPPLC